VNRCGLIRGSGRFWPSTFVWAGAGGGRRAHVVFDPGWWRPGGAFPGVSKTRNFCPLPPPFFFGPVSVVWGFFVGGPRVPGCCFDPLWAPVCFLPVGLPPGGPSLPGGGPSLGPLPPPPGGAGGGGAFWAGLGRGPPPPRSSALGARFWLAPICVTSR